MTIPATFDSLNRDELISVSKDLLRENGDLRAENEELRKMRVELENKVRRLEADIDELEARILSMQLTQRYSDGMVAGLRYALQCNSTSGTLEVREA